MAEEDLPKVKSLAKALHLLECFTIQTPEWGITDLSEKLGLAKSNTHSILSTFEQMGYITQLPNKKYTLGLKMLEYAFIINQNLGYPKAIYDLVLKTANLTDQIVYFGLPYGTDVLYLYVAHPAARLKDFPYREILGEKAPLYCTGIGKAILAAMPEDTWPAHIPAQRRRFTPDTVVDYDAIIDDLQRTRSRGYSMDDREREIGLRCVGVPVFNSSGQLVAGISVSGPETAMTDEKLIECAGILKSTALEMKNRIYR